MKQSEFNKVMVGRFFLGDIIKKVEVKDGKTKDAKRHYQERKGKPI